MTIDSVRLAHVLKSLSNAMRKHPFLVWLESWIWMWRHR